MHQRDTSGLKRHAQEKREEAKQRTEEGIKQLVKEGKTISFKTVAEISGVSRAWLYQQDDIRARIEHLRKQQSKKKTVPVQQRTTNSSNVAIVRTLKERVKKIQSDNQELRQQLEVAYGRLVHSEDEAERYKRQVDSLQGECERLREQLLEKVKTQSEPEVISNSKGLSLVQELGIPISSALAQTIENVSVEVVENAIQAFREAVQEGGVRHPGGWLKRAIEEQWMPNSNYVLITQSDLFNEWWNQAYRKGLVKAATQINGIQHVLTSDEEWIPFTDVQSFFQTKQFELEQDKHNKG